MFVFLLSLLGMVSTGPADLVLHCLTAVLACLLAGVILTAYFSPRERAWRKWRRRIRKKYGSAET